MMNQPTYRPGQGEGFEARLRTLRILWAAFLTTIGLYVLVTRFVFGSREAAEVGAGNQTLLAALAALALATVASSFVLKRVFYARAAGRGEPAQFQTGLIIALALCESAAIFGLIGLFITLDRYAYALIALGALGQLLHFPRRDQLAAAYHRRQ